MSNSRRPNLQTSSSDRAAPYYSSRQRRIPDPNTKVEVGSNWLSAGNKPPAVGSTRAADSSGVGNGDLWLRMIAARSRRPSPTRTRTEQNTSNESWGNPPTRRLGCLQACSAQASIACCGRIVGFTAFVRQASSNGMFMSFWKANGVAWKFDPTQRVKLLLLGNVHHNERVSCS